MTSLSSDIGLKAPINNPVFTGTISGISKSMVGLTNVDDTNDINKPISTATQSALNLKQNNLTISPMKGESILATNTASQLKTISPNPDDNDINISTSSSTDGSQRINIGLNTSLSNLTKYYTKVDSDITTATLNNNINTKANIIDVYSKTESDTKSANNNTLIYNAIVLKSNSSDVYTKTQSDATLTSNSTTLNNAINLKANS